MLAHPNSNASSSGAYRSGTAPNVLSARQQAAPSVERCSSRSFCYGAAWCALRLGTGAGPLSMSEGGSISTSTKDFENVQAPIHRDEVHRR